MSRKPEEIDSVTRNAAEMLHITFEPGTTPALARQMVFNAPVPNDLQKEAAELGVDITGLTYGSAIREVSKHRGDAAKAVITKGRWAPGTVLKLDGMTLLITRVEHGSGKVGYKAYSGVKLVKTGDSTRKAKPSKSSKNTDAADVDLLPLWETKPMVYATELRGATVCRVTDLRIS